MRPGCDISHNCWSDPFMHYTIFIIIIVLLAQNHDGETVSYPAKHCSSWTKGVLISVAFAWNETPRALLWPEPCQENPAGITTALPDLLSAGNQSSGLLASLGECTLSHESRATDDSSVVRHTRINKQIKVTRESQSTPGFTLYCSRLVDSVCFHWSLLLTIKIQITFEINKVIVVANNSWKF